MSGVRCVATNSAGAPCRAWAVRGQEKCRGHLDGPVPLLPRPKCHCGSPQWPHMVGPKCPPEGKMPDLPSPRMTIVQAAPSVPLDADRRQQILELISAGARPLQAAKAVGVSAATMRRNLTKAPWREAVNEAQDEAVEMAEAAVWRLGIGETTGQPHFEALKFWLMSQARHRGWTDPRKVELAVSGQVEHVLSREAAIAEIIELEQRWRARVEGKPELEPGVIEAVVIEEDDGDA